MTKLWLFPLFLLTGCGEPADRLTDEQATAQQNAAIDETVAIAVPEPISTPAPAPSAASYSALGNEPGWSLNVTPKTMRYQGDYGSVSIAEATPARFRPVPGRYAATRLSVTIAPGPCNDGMSDRTYRDTVTVVADGKTVSGCGGGVIADPDVPAEPDSEPALNGN